MRLTKVSVLVVLFVGFCPPAIGENRYLGTFYDLDRRGHPFKFEVWQCVWNGGSCPAQKVGGYVRNHEFERQAVPISDPTPFDEQEGFQVRLRNGPFYSRARGRHFRYWTNGRGQTLYYDEISKSEYEREYVLLKGLGICPFERSTVKSISAAKQQNLTIVINNNTENNFNIKNNKNTTIVINTEKDGTATYNSQNTQISREQLEKIINVINQGGGNQSMDSRRLNQGSYWQPRRGKREIEVSDALAILALEQQPPRSIFVYGPSPYGARRTNGGVWLTALNDRK